MFYVFKLLKIPAGTTITDSDNGQLLADLLEEGETFIVAKGGTKGLGNVHFKSPSMVRPRTSTEGTPGEELFVELELKSIADVGLVGSLYLCIKICHTLQRGKSF